MDSTFGTNGIATAPISPGVEIGLGMVVQPDDKIVMAGHSGTPNNYDVALARFMPDGTLDATFGGDGMVIAPLSPNDDATYAVALDPTNSKIVIAGRCGPIGIADSIMVARFMPTGVLDTSFNGTGAVITTFSTLSFNAWDVLVQPDGKILVAATGLILGDSQLVVLRYDQTGMLDNSFGTGGIAGTGHMSSAGALDLMPDGRIVAAGSYGDLQVTRFLPNGMLDNTFGNGGMVITDAGGYEGVYECKVLPSGDCLVVGTGDDGQGNLGMLIVRFAATGALDNSFSGDGIVKLQLGPNTDSAHSVDVQPDGKILVGGRATSPGAYHFCLVRLEVDGDLDGTFGTNGITMSQNVGPWEAREVGMQSDGSVLLAGYIPVGPVDSDFAVARYNNNGANSTETLLKNERLTIAPNPFAGIAKVMGLDVAKSYRFTSTDAVGRSIATWTSPGSLSTIDATAYPPGIYVLQVSDHEHVLGRRAFVVE